MPAEHAACACTHQRCCNTCFGQLLAVFCLLWRAVLLGASCRGPDYMEVDIDVASSSVARHVVGLVAGAAKSVVVDMGILLQVPHGADSGCRCRLCFARILGNEMLSWNEIVHVTGRMAAVVCQAVTPCMGDGLTTDCVHAAQGNAADELPESLLGTMRLCNVSAVPLSHTSHEICHCLKSRQGAHCVSAMSMMHLDMQIDLSTASYLDVNTGKLHAKTP